AEASVDHNAVVAVPLHHRRSRRRGYNQSILLASEVSRQTGVPLIEGSLVRLRDTPPQARTRSGGERRANVEGAFGCRDQRLRGKRVVIVDDICTTGATLNACAAAAKTAGASWVWGLTVAAEV
ncbi:MAG: phosphoribosyltransferase family protein, partial [Chloroflexota bacterium]